MSPCGLSLDSRSGGRSLQLSVRQAALRTAGICDILKSYPVHIQSGGNGTNTLRQGVIEMSSNFLLTEILIAIVLLAVIGGIVAIIVTSIVRKRRNDLAPQKAANASVLAKHTSTQQHPIAGDASGAHGYTTFTIYHVTFLTDDNAQLEFAVDGTVYDRLTEGVRGRLTYQGTRFLGFQNGGN